MGANDSRLQKIAAELAETDALCHRRARGVPLPRREEIVGIMEDMRELMFPDYYPHARNRAYSREELLCSVFRALCTQLCAAYALAGEDPQKEIGELAAELLSRLPKIRTALCKDIDALYEGDPAARSREEILLSYPGFYAISVYRIAHEFYVRRVPYLSRMMTEHAHEKTGIDIHAGASIGEYFFIDHGTGIVIGETTVIGDHVKLYQGVTLGAKSFELDDDGNPVKGIKRHPNIGNGVIIYANATILGGRTAIGDGATIGGNVWITRSVEAGKTVTYSENYRK